MRTSSFQSRGRNPDRIVVFRDGGSMGAIEQIAAIEMKLGNQAGS